MVPRLRRTDSGAGAPRIPWIEFMPLSDLLAPTAIFPFVKAGNKKQTIQELSAEAAKLTGLDERKIFEILLQRERLGSTGIGHGVAIPHGKLAKIDRIFGLFARLEKPIEFDALDGEPVDLIFLLLAPESAGADHLKALASIARLLRDSNIAKKLRNSRDAGALYATLTAKPATHAA